MRTRPLTAAVFLPLVLMTALTACSSAEDKPTTGRTLTAAEQLAAAKTRTDAATSMHLTLTSKGIPASATGVLGADGSGTHAPAFKGTLNARLAGIEAKVEVVAIDKLLYLKLPFTTEFAAADPKEYNAPDPAQLFSKDGGITSLMTETTSPALGGTTRQGGEVLRTITGKLPGTSVQKLLNIGDSTKTFDVTYGITDPGGELRTVTVVGPFYTGATSTYTLMLDKYGAPVDITKP